MTIQNADIARAFEEIAALLELGDENPFRVRAYRNAASEIETLSFEGPKRVRVLYKKLGVGSLAGLQRAALEGRVRELEGFGEKTEKKILELLRAR
jgi:DNA polymerase (family 10)